MPERQIDRRNNLTVLLLPLADRMLVLPNVAVAELIDYQEPIPTPNAPAWALGRIAWRDRVVPLVSFEAACGTGAMRGERARIVVLNAVGESAQGFVAILVQGIPRSYKVDSQLSYLDVPLAALELAAVQIADQIARVPDLLGLERLVQQG